MSKQKNRERDIEIYYRRQAGQKYRFIGMSVGLSTEQVRQIYKRLNKKVLTCDDWKTSLSIRNQNALKQVGVKYMSEIMEISPVTFLKIKNYGIKSFKELQEALMERGYDWK